MPRNRTSMDNTKMIMEILCIFIPATLAQFEGSMGAQSNLDEQQRPIVPQCPDRWMWPCHNGQCIPTYDVCDGIPQCTDGSDEWNCQQQQQANWRKQGHGYNEVANPPTQKPLSTPVATTTSTAAPESSYVILTTGQLFTSFVIFVVLCFIIVYVIKRRAKTRQMSRNRRGNFFQAQDSDEDDVLISSMYS